MLTAHTTTTTNDVGWKWNTYHYCHTKGYHFSTMWVL